MTTSILIGVFAHNEEQRIAQTLQDLARQDIFGEPHLTAHVFVLANGCTDATVHAAREAIHGMQHSRASHFSVLDLPLAGKSRTWNLFVHDLCVGRAQFTCFVDGDIRIPEAGNLRLMFERITASEACVVVASRPRKDIEVAPAALPLVQRVMVLASGTASDWRNSIAGSLYMARTSALAAIHMPIGLPVEDGFLRAMILTRLLTEDADFSRIHAEPGIWHVYESLRTVPALVRHQTRLVVGSAINTVVFDHLNANAQGFDQRSALLREAAQDEEWLARALRTALPRWPWGFVPVHFLVKRMQGLRARPGLGAGRAVLVAAVGLPFDALVYLNAQLQMARGKGAGYW